MLGYYQSQAATDIASRRQALSIMELGEPYMDHPQFKFGIAEAEAALGNIEVARERVLRVLASKPDFEPAKKLLTSLPTK